jgi:hypothetical protein
MKSDVVAVRLTANSAIRDLARISPQGERVFWFSFYPMSPCVGHPLYPSEE